MRDLYAVGADRMLMVASDRLSAFDVVMKAPVPGKGRLLTQMALFWFDELRAIVPNHLSGEAPEGVVAPDEVPDHVRFAAIWSNPAIRIGKPALHAMLLRWLGRLADDGTATMVVHKHLGSDSLQQWLVRQGHPTERLSSAKGYRLLRSGPRRVDGDAQT